LQFVLGADDKFALGPLGGFGARFTIPISDDIPQLKRFSHDRDGFLTGLLLGPGFVSCDWRPGSFLRQSLCFRRSRFAWNAF
jgi:hypothetical protein